VFDLDGPIESCDEDEVNRCQFAKKVARAMSQYRDFQLLWWVSLEVGALEKPQLSAWYAKY